MPKATPFQASFTGGEASPLVYGRVDSPRYKQSLQTALNYLPTLQGAMGRRPGTKYLNNIKDSTKPGVLIPFTFSTTQAYMLEFGDKYIRFYANNGQIITSGTTYKFAGGSFYNGLKGFSASRATNVYGQGESGGTITTIAGGSILELSTLYAYADLPLLRWAQDADTLYLFHPSYPTLKLQRLGQQLWELRTVTFLDGPYLAANSYATPGDSTNTTMTGVSIFGNSEAQVTAGPSLTITGAITDPASSGQIQITTSAPHGMITGTKIFITLVTGTTEANNNNASNSHPGAPYYWVITVNGASTFLLQGSTFANAWVSGGTVQPAFFWQDMGVTTPPDQLRLMAFVTGGSRTWGMLEGFPNAATANLYMPNGVVPSSLATAWYLGTESIGNFAAVGCFHQNRLVKAGYPLFPQQIDGSFSGQYENFAPSASSTLAVADSNAYSFQLASREVNAIRWLVSSAQGLLAGSYSAEWAITPSSASAALTPTNFSAAQTSFFGSSNADAVQSGNAALYIQRAQRKVREMNYFFQVGTFRSTDLTEISEHITLPTVTKLAVQKETQPLVWGLRSDGNLVSMLYNRDDSTLQAGWTRHQLGGQSDSGGTQPVVLSIGFIPDPTISFDQMWLLVQRYINGATIVAVEYMTKIFDDSVLQEDAFQFDCGATFYNPLTITGISLASPAVVTSAAHGLSAGQVVKIVSVVGLNIKSTDINGNVTTSNFCNEKTFVVGTTTTNTFQLLNADGSNADSTLYSAWVSGGMAAKLVTTISGLTWLENETVSVLADGGVHPDVVVSSGGVITLNTPAAKVQIGYKFNSDGKQLRTEAGAAAGSSMGSIRRTCRMALMVHSMGDLAIGTDFKNLIPVEFPRFDNNQANVSNPLFSGMVREGVESDYGFDSQLCWRQNTGLPGIINGITSFVEEYDV